jgi:hypothetical protein
MRLRPVVAVRACAVLVTASLAMSSSASAEPEPLVGADAGLDPAGIVETPDGGTWIADEARGVCRVAPGAEPLLVESPWCSAEPAEGEDEEEEEEEHEEVEGDAPVASRKGQAEMRPVSPSGLAFDPETDNFYVGDRDSAGGGVWRLHLDRASGTIDRGTPIASISDRVQTVALGPATPAGRDVFFLTKREQTVMRIADPATAPKEPELVAGAGGEDVSGMVATKNALYLAGGAVKRLSLTPGGPAVLEPVAGFDDLTVSALALDPERGRLYAGTTGRDPEDVIEVLDLTTGEHERYEQGFTGVTALAMRSAGGVLAVAADPAQAVTTLAGQARIWRVALQPLGRPHVTVTSRPPDASPATSATFTYASREGTSFECRLDDGAFARCPGTGSGRQTYSDLAEGTHRFFVRASDDLTGLSESVRFTLDRTPPTVTVIRPEDPYVEGGPAPRIRFSAYESAITYTCSLDGGPFAACWSGNPIENLTAGVHALRVVAVDAAGNASDPDAEMASARINVLARTQAPSSRPAEPSVTPGATAPALAPAPAPAPSPGESGAPAQRGPVLLPFRLRVAGPSSRTLRLRFGVRAPVGAARLRVWIKDARGRTVLTRTVAVRPGRNHFDLVLRRGPKPGRYLVTAALRTAGGTQGNSQTHRLRLRGPRD